MDFVYRDIFLQFLSNIQCGGQALHPLHCVSILVLACFVGYYVIWKVTPALHAPLMAVTNAISSVIILGAVIATVQNSSFVAKIFGFFAVILASINIFGGFSITQRMLNMFKKRKE